MVLHSIPWDASRWSVERDRAIHTDTDTYAYAASVTITHTLVGAAVS